MGALDTQIPTIQLSSLTVTAGVFKDNKNKNFLFEHLLTNTTVTLHGWAFKKLTGGNDQFSTDPDVKLTPFQQTTVTIGPDFYVSNQMLSKKTVFQIDSLTKRRDTRVFTPTDTLTGRIYYEISIRPKDKSHPLDGPIPPLNTNPSPPHQSFDN